MKKHLFTILMTIGLLAFANTDIKADADDGLLERMIETKEKNVDGIDAKVEEFDMENGYLASRIEIGTYEIFVTGLSASNIDKIENELIRNYNSTEQFSIEDEKIIDAEKIKDLYNNDKMCWAATSSNMLTYTGWAQKAGFENEDITFMELEKHFKNNGGYIKPVMSWFFNGGCKYLEAVYGFNAESCIKDYGQSGSYIKTVLAENITDEVYIDSKDTFNNICLLKYGLKNGFAIGITEIQGRNNVLSLGHNMNCWGYIVDTKYSEDSQEHYKALITSDNVSSLNYKSRFEAPNQYNVYHLEYIEGYGNNNDIISGFNMKDYSAYYDNFVVGCIGLAPINSIEERYLNPTDEGGVGDTSKACELFPSMYYTAADTSEYNNWYHIYKLSSEEKFDICVGIANCGDVYCGDNVNCKLEIFDKDDNLVYSDTFEVANIKSGYQVLKCVKVSEGLKAGDYQAVITVNSDKKVQEAIYNNNESSFEFEVRDCDYKDASVSANLEEESDYLKVALELKDIPEEHNNDVYECYVYASYFDNNKWSKYEAVGYYDNLNSLKNGVYLDKRGTAVKIRVQYSFGDGPFVVVDSNECKFANNIKPETTNNTNIKKQETPTTRNTDTTKNVEKNTQQTTSGTVDYVDKSAVKIKSIKNSKRKAFVVKFRKVKNAKKYEVCYSTNRKFKKSVSKMTTKLSFTAKKLKKGKKYYVKVRATNGNAKGKWSKVVKIIITK